MNTWNALAAPAVDWLVSTSWQAAVLAVLVVGIQIVFRKVLSARWRYLLWILVVARLLFPSLPQSSMSLYQYVPTSPVNAIHFDQVASLSVAAPPAATSKTPTFVSSISVPPGPVSTPISPKGVLFAIWLTGFLALAASLVERNLRFRRRVLLDALPADEAKCKLADSVARDMGVHRRLAVIETDLLETPAVVGLFAPKLLLPRKVAALLSSDELTLIFRHELAHLKRGDLWVNFLVCVLQVVHWFNPVLWWAFGRMRHDRELATDALALRSTLHAQQAYGETLVKLAAGNMPRTSLNPAIGILENHRRIRQRVEQIARLKPNAYAWSALGVALLVAIALLGLTKAPALGATGGNQKNDSNGQLQFRFVVDKKDVKLDARAQTHVIGEMEAVVRGLDLSADRNPGNSFNSLTPDMIEKDGNYLHVAYPTPRTFTTTKGSIRAREVYIVNDPDANLYGFPPGGIVLVSETGQLTHAYCAAEAPLLNLTFSSDVYPHLSDRNKGNFNDELSGYFNFSKEEELEPPLRIIAAAKAGDLTTIKDLLAQGVKLDQLPGGETTLLFAAGSPEVAEFLIAQGVPVDARNKGGFTALMAICYNDSGSRKEEMIAPTARVLLKHGANPNAHTEYPRVPGLTPLMLARNGATVDTLVEGGADVHARFNGVGLLDELDLGYKQLSYFQALAAHGLPIDNHSNGVHLLNWAISQDLTDVVDWLLKRGVAPNAMDPVNATFQGSFPARPMLVAAGSGADRAAKLLVAHGGKIDDAAIDLALDDQRENVLEVFHEAGSGNFPELLYQVSQKAPAEKIEALLKAGAPVDPPGGHMTPLALAARHGDLASVQVLIQYGADPNRKGTAGTPLGLAGAGGYEDVVNFLLQKGARPDLDTMNAAIRGCIVQFQFYKHAASLSPQPFYRSIQALAKAGGYKDIRPDQMKAAFLIEPGYGFSLDPEIVKIQLASGLNPSSKDAKGESALDAVKAAYAKNSDTRARAYLQQIINLFVGAKSAAPGV